MNKTPAYRLKANTAWRERHREAHLERRRLRHAERMADPAYQQRLKELRDARRTEKREYDRTYRQGNAERLDEIKRAWLAANADLRKAISKSYKARRRAREGGGVETSVLRQWAEDQPKVCFYCTADCEASYHIDHFLPLSKGGVHVLTNLRISCAPCNLKKNAADPLEWMDRVHAEMFQELARAAA